MAATIRVPSDKNPARRAAETRSFGTTKREVLALADWLRCWQVPAVVMEATGDYWKGPFYRLEAEGFECVLADAEQVRHLPGRPAPSVSDFLCAGLFAVRYRMFIRCPLFALSAVAMPGLRAVLAETDLPLLLRADAACPGFRGVLCYPGRLLPDPLRIAWRPFPSVVKCSRP